MLTIDPATATAAEDLVFATTTGGPLVLLSAAHRGDWWGCYGVEGEDGDEPEEGESHYDLACEIEGEAGRLPLEAGGEALVLTESQPTAVVHTSSGVLLVRWAGADTAAALLACAFADESVAGSWEDLDETWAHTGGEAVLMDAAEDGRSEEPMEVVVTFALQPGRYAVSARSWDGEARHPDGTEEEVMSVVIRLDRRG